MTGHELYEFVKNDPELLSIVRQALLEDGALSARRGRRPDPRRRATNEFRRFWSNQSGARFHLELERKLGPVLAARMMRGGGARIRTVMILIVDDVLRELESQEVEPR